MVRQNIKPIAAAGKSARHVQPRDNGPRRLKVCSTVTPSQRVQLVGRQLHLQQAFQALIECRYVEIVGGPGEGKTTLLQHLVDRVCQWWQRQPAPEAGSQLAIALSVDLSLEGVQAACLKDSEGLSDLVAIKLMFQVGELAGSGYWRALLRWLQQRAPAPVLLAFDNVEQCLELAEAEAEAEAEDNPRAETVREEFQEVLQQLHAMEHVHLVVATCVRTPGLPQAAVPAGSVVELAQLSEAAGLQLVESRLGAGHRWSADGRDRAAAEQLVRLVRCNPLTLVAAAGLVRQGQHKWEDVLHSAQQGTAAAASTAAGPNGGTRTLVAALAGWMCDLLGEAERQLLASACVFPGSFTAFAIAKVTPALRPADVSAALRLLAGACLLRPRVAMLKSNDSQKGLSFTRYSLHGLARSAVSQILGPPAAQQARLGLFARWMVQDAHGPGQLLHKVVPEGHSPDTALWLYLLREELQNFAAVAGALGAAVAAEAEEVVDGAGIVAFWLCRTVGLEPVGRQLHHKAVGTAVRLLGPEHPATLTAKFNYGTSLGHLDELAEARRVLEEVLEVRKRVLGPQHSRTLGAADGLVTTLREAGELVEARRVLEWLAGVQTEALGATHLDTLQVKLNLINVVQELEDYAATRRLLEELLEARVLALGPDNLQSLQVRYHLALVVQKMGELGKARRLLEEAAAGYAQAQGAEHRDTLQTQSILAYVLYELKELGEARRLQEQVAEAHARVLGAEHPTTLQARHALASTVHEMGELVEAKRLQEEVVEARARVLGAEHPDTLHAQDNLAVTLIYLRDPAGAWRMYEPLVEARTRVLGAEHADTLGSMAGAAYALWQLGKLAEARQLAEAAVAGHERVVGPEHPGTWSARDTLGVIMRDMGEAEEGRRLQEGAVAALEPLWGRDDRALLEGKHHLGVTLLACGEVEEARRVLEAVLEARTRVLGAEDQSTLETKDVLAAMGG